MQYINEMIILSPGLTKSETSRKARNLQTYSWDVTKPSSILCLCFQVSSGTLTPQTSCFKRYCKLHAFQIGWENNLLFILWEVKSHRSSSCGLTRVRGAKQGWGSPVSPLVFWGMKKQGFPGCTKHAKFKSWKNEWNNANRHKWYNLLWEMSPPKLCHFFIVLHFVYFQAFVFLSFLSKPCPNTTKQSRVEFPCPQLLSLGKTWILLLAFHYSLQKFKLFLPLSDYGILIFTTPPICTQVLFLYLFFPWIIHFPCQKKTCQDLTSLFCYTLSIKNRVIYLYL